MQIFSVLTTACCNSKSILEPWFFDRKGGIVLRVKALLRQIWFWRVLSVLCALVLQCLFFPTRGRPGKFPAAAAAGHWRFVNRCFPGLGLHAPLPSMASAKPRTFWNFLRWEFYCPCACGALLPRGRYGCLAPACSAWPCPWPTSLFRALSRGGGAW